VWIISTWDQFVALRSEAHGTYLGIDSRTGDVLCSARSVSITELFQIELKVRSPFVPPFALLSFSLSFVTFF
jgi:hypothetical protein